MTPGCGVAVLLLAQLVDESNPEPDSRRLSAALPRLVNKNDFSTFKDHIQRGANVDHLASSGRPLLMHAVLAPDRNHFVQYLIQQGANLEIVDPKGYTPMHAAAFSGNHGAARMLIEGGAEFDTPHTDGFSPMMRAVARRSLETLKVLLEAGADPDMLHYHKKTGNWITAYDFAPDNMRPILTEYSELKATGASISMEQSKKSEGSSDDQGECDVDEDDGECAA